MALTRTTLSSAAGVNDREIVVASATGIVAGDLVRIDQEFMVVQKDYSSGTTVPVRRGQLGSATKAHVATAGVVHGTAQDDWDAPGVGATVNNMIAGRPVIITSITAATSTLVHAPAGCDHRVILNGTSVITLTIPVPTLDMDGDQLTIISNGAAAHVPTFTGGLGGAGASYDAVTNNATGKFALTVFAANETWQIPVAPAMTGTVTNITAGIA
jgi:hypothetical protein